MRANLTLAVVTLNEEKNIERCIRSVPFADEIIVLDSGSTDKTKEVSEALGAKFKHQDWLGYEKQKQMALDLSSNDWVLALDADEELSSELQAEIELLLSGESLEKNDAFRVPRLSRHFERWIRYGGWYPDYQVRLINKNRAKWQGGGLHEYVSAESIGTLKSDLYHYVFSDLAHQVDTNNKYSGLGAEKLASERRSFSLLKLIFRPVGKFIECFFLKQGFRDGLPGFVIAVGAAYSMFLRYAKLYEKGLRSGS